MAGPWHTLTGGGARLTRFHLPARPARGVTVPGAPATIEFTLAPEAADTLHHLPGMSTTGRARPVALSWHDTADGALAADGLALSLAEGRWTLERLHATAALVPPPVLRCEARRELLGDAVPAATAAVATLSGTRRTLRWQGTDGEAGLTVLHGRLDDGAVRCRVTAHGPALVLATLADVLAAAVPVGVPRVGLAADAVRAAGRDAPPRVLGAMQAGPGRDVGTTLAAVLGHLLDVMLHWADRIPGASDPEPVHQMRVATRRLRSALAVFRRAAPCPALAALALPLKACAGQLGEARDWDVFLRGAGATLAAAFPDDARCAALLRAAARARLAAYGRLGEYLAGPAFRSLSVALATAAALHPWDSGEAAMHGGIEAFGAAALARRLKHVRRTGRGIADLPVPALHELRKDCKRLRYTAELFAPLFPAHPARRFVRRLAALQEELGLLNDGAAVDGMLAQLGRAERGHAAGLLRGLVAAQAGPARGRIYARWHHFRAAGPFWTV